MSVANDAVNNCNFKTESIPHQQPGMIGNKYQPDYNENNSKP